MDSLIWACVPLLGVRRIPLKVLKSLVTVMSQEIFFHISFKKIYNNVSLNHKPK